jgi:phosphoglycolate phosphatase
MPNRLALFDCDGTLVDSQHNIVTCMNDAFQRAGLAPPKRDATKRIVGLSLLPAVIALLPDAEPELQRQIAEDYKTAFQRLRGHGLVEEPLFDGILEALDALQAAGCVLGVATGKSDRGLELCLKHHGIFDRFVTLQTADRHPSKPDPSMIFTAMLDAEVEPENTYMIGDTVFDIHMGIAAQTHSIGVNWGYHLAEELAEAGAVCVVDHPAELIRVMQ